MHRDPRTDLLRVVDERLAALLRWTDGWGPPIAVELQFLLLVEMRHAVVGLPREEVDGVNERYWAFLDERVPGPPVPLAHRMKLAERSSEPFVDLLRAFLHEETSRHTRHLDFPTVWGHMNDRHRREA